MAESMATARAFARKLRSTRGHLVSLSTAILVILTAALSGCGDREAAEAPETEPAAGPAPHAAERILRNGRIYTLDPTLPWASAVAVRDGVFVAVGDDAAVQPFVGAGTEVVDLAGAMAMPGINDAHSHPVVGAAGRLFKCNFAFTATPEEIRAALERCIAARPDMQWIQGGYWGSAFFDRYEMESPRGFLDAISPDKPVVLSDDANHNIWVNSRALELLGIDESTPDPEGGRIVRDADGKPNGLLLETAYKQVSSRIPDWTTHQYVEAVREAVRIANGFGITGMKDAGAFDAILPAYRKVDDEGGLSVHAVASIRTFYGRRDAPLDAATLAGIEDKRSRYSGGNLQLNTVKIFLDGVPTSARTAAMLGPYLPDGQHPEGFDGGPVHVDADVLRQDLVALDSRGFTVKMHAAGDRSIRVALDAIEYMRKTNGDSGRIPELAHAGFIADTDLPRFAALHVAADISPQIWHPSPIIDSIVSALGERGTHYWPNRALLDSGALVVAGSDWPAGVESPSPWLGIEALVTRADPAGISSGQLWPKQAVTLEEALEIYTRNGAAALGLAGETGSIEKGKSADLIVLDRNLFEVPAAEIGETQVEQTWFRGQRVHQADQSIADAD